MWLLRSRPTIVQVCRYCSGPFGMMRPAKGFCSTYCVAWAENEKRERLLHPPDELVALLKYPP